MTSIYILKCENDKWYIGRSNNPTVRIRKHFEKYGSAWTSLHNPIEVENIIDNCDYYDEDKITKQYMEKYGIDNVRGGSYCQLEITPQQREFINKEINNVKDVCFNCGEGGHFISRCPNKKKTNNTFKKDKKDKKDKKNKKKPIKIDEIDFIEDKQYENDFVGISPIIENNNNDLKENICDILSDSYSDSDSDSDYSSDVITETSSSEEEEDTKEKPKYVNMDAMTFYYDHLSTEYGMDIDYHDFINKIIDKKNSICPNFKSLSNIKSLANIKTLSNIKLTIILDMIGTSVLLCIGYNFIKDIPFV